MFLWPRKSSILSLMSNLPLMTESTSDSVSSHRKTSGIAFFAKFRFRCFFDPGSERPRLEAVHPLGHRIPISQAWLPNPYRFSSENLCSDDDFEMLLSDWLDRQTDRQTDKHFLFVRPFLSEKGILIHLRHLGNQFVHPEPLWPGIRESEKLGLGIPRYLSCTARCLL